ncbi:hypothetical protein SERLADRAFT_385589, partial [Serpula lacrymans var. lacrymans S7.9]
MSLKLEAASATSQALITQQTSRIKAPRSLNGKELIATMNPPFSQLTSLRPS